MKIIQAHKILVKYVLYRVYRVLLIITYPFMVQLMSTPRDLNFVALTWAELRFQS